MLLFNLTRINGVIMPWMLPIEDIRQGGQITHVNAEEENADRACIAYAPTGARWRLRILSADREARAN